MCDTKYKSYIFNKSLSTACMFSSVLVFSLWKLSKILLLKNLFCLLFFMLTTLFCIIKLNPNRRSFLRTLILNSQIFYYLVGKTSFFCTVCSNFLFRTFHCVFHEIVFFPFSFPEGHLKIFSCLLS